MSNLCAALKQSLHAATDGRSDITINSSLCLWHLLSQTQSLVQGKKLGQSGWSTVQNGRVKSTKWTGQEYKLDGSAVQNGRVMSTKWTGQQYKMDGSRVQNGRVKSTNGRVKSTKWTGQEYKVDGSRVQSGRVMSTKWIAHPGFMHLR
jgi:hypothetical protein